MNNWNYFYSGLMITSNIELPEWELFLQPGEWPNPDVTIKTEISTEPFTDTPKLSASANEYSFLLPQIGYFRITGGSAIVISHLPNVEQHKLRLFLLGSAWGGLCYQRGLLAIHAGAVQIGNEAVLLCAAQGKGKSTMTAFLANRGHALISDDLCCVDMQKGIQPAIYPSTQRLRLWSDALDLLGWERKNFERDFFRFDKFLVPWSGKQVTHPVPIHSICLLEWGDLSLKRLTGVDALKSFISAATYRGELLHQMGESGPYWNRCLELIERVPVWVLSRPKDLTSMDSVSALVENHAS